MESKLESFFKPEARKSGRDLVAKDAVFYRQGAETRVEASVRGTPPAQVVLWSESISSPIFFADCSCPSSQKGQLCKHIWATLLLAQEKTPDFLDSKLKIEKANPAEAGSPSRSAYATKSSEKKKFVSPHADEQKRKQAEFRKQAYEKQKLRAKEIKSQARPAPKSSRFESAPPAGVKAALEYFEKNGFSLSHPVSEEDLSQAKRVLSRVFHPDKGGSHEEIVELLRHVEALANSQF